MQGEIQNGLEMSICSFGQFRVTYKGIVLTEEAVRSEMLTKLLTYILLHRKRSISVRELSEVLWGNEDASDNPTGALKNLMYRLRNVLKKNFGDAEQFVLTSLGAYCWNPAIPVKLDTEEFEAALEEAKHCKEDCDKVMAYEKALKFYQGRFLDNHSDENWIMPITTYYQSLFITNTKKLAELYRQTASYEEMERVCNKALLHDNLDEELHCELLQALIGQNKEKTAVEHYKETVKLYYEQLGVHNPPLLEKVYKDILSKKKVADAVELNQVSEDIQESAPPKGVYICGYMVFQELYHVEARRIHRMGISEYVMLLSLKQEQTPDLGTAQRYMMNRAMDRMEKILQSSLRIGDVAARYSDSQYIILLPMCTLESGKKIAERIRTQFEKDSKNKKFKMDYEIEEVTSAESSFIK